MLTQGEYTKIINFMTSEALCKGVAIKYSEIALFLLKSSSLLPCIDQTN